MPLAQYPAILLDFVKRFWKQMLLIVFVTICCEIFVLPFEESDESFRLVFSY